MRMPASRFLSGAKSTMASIALANRHGSDADARIVGPSYMDDTRIAREISGTALPPTDPITGRDDGIVEMAAGRQSLNEPFRR
jgi:hypothetical protein